MEADEMGTANGRQMHDTSSICGWVHTGTRTSAAATGRAIHHSDRYKKLKFKPIPRWRVGGGR